MIRHIIFDAYGTLISTGDGSIRATQSIWQRHDARADATTIYREWKRYHREHIDTLTAFVPEREIFVRDLQRLYDAHGIRGDAAEDVTPMLDSQYHRALFDETREVLDALREQYDIAIGSTTDTAPLLDNLKRGNLYIDHIFTSESLRVYKPNPTFYTAILTAMGWSADETLFVGDSPIDDVAGPKRVGMRAILLDRNNRHTGASLPTAPDAIIQHLKQLKDIISAIS